ncbi:MAG: permease-like cell division protein FtsX [Negativicutes bacterium]
MTIRKAEYFIIEAIGSLKHNRLMALAAVTTMAISLLILGMFFIMVMNVNHIASSIESQVQISAYLKEDVSEEQINEIGKHATGIKGVANVKFIDKETALKIFRERLGENKSIIEALGDTNPLPNYFEIRAKNAADVKSIAEKLEQSGEFENIKYGQEIIEQLFRLTKFIRIIGVFVIVFLSLAALFIISNTIRITVFARRREIEIMKYVGATDSFIRWPFVLEGIILGVGGSLIAILLLSWTYGTVVEMATRSLTFLPIMPIYPLLTFVNIGIILIGCGIGAVGSGISIRRFMRV